MAVTRAPIGLVVGKRNRERLDEIGVTDEVVFNALKEALSATKVISVDTKTGKGNRNVPDHDTRIKAVRLYMEITMFDPKSATKASKTELTSMESFGVLEESTMPGTPNAPLQFPNEKVLTVEEQKRRQIETIERRNGVR